MPLKDCVYVQKILIVLLVKDTSVVQEKCTRKPECVLRSIPVNLVFNTILLYIYNVVPLQSIVLLSLVRVLLSRDVMNVGLCMGNFLSQRTSEQKCLLV